jgi:leucyl/phenylalanyl-tRNA--protein transferase
MSVYWLTDENSEFPAPELANAEGILAIGGDLSPDRLLAAYRMGIFPWFNEGEPVMWWSPDPRMVLLPHELKVARSMRPYLNQEKFRVTFDTCFRTVMQLCQAPRPDSGGSWITGDMVEAYCRLHEMGHAHSVEVWEGHELVGGLYGVAIGKVFFGESMFKRVSNASKYGFIMLVRRLQGMGFKLVDCQQQTRHLRSLGARSIPRSEFLGILRENEAEPSSQEGWRDML